MSRRRKPDAGERALWHHVTRSVRPLDGARMADLTGEADSAAKDVTPAKPPMQAAKQAAMLQAMPRAQIPHQRQKSQYLPETPVPPGTGLDRRSRQKLARGQLQVEARLDLHGHNRHAAHDALKSFIGRCRASDMRCVLVITGKGLLSPDGGVLRALLPGWLDEPPLARDVLAHAPARAGHGGGGAFYLLLRRRRK